MDLLYDNIWSNKATPLWYKRYLRIKATRKKVRYTKRYNGIDRDKLFNDG